MGLPQVRKKQELVQHYVEAISDLKLTTQLQASQHQSLLAQVEKRASTLLAPIWHNGCRPRLQLEKCVWTGAAT